MPNNLTTRTLILALDTLAELGSVAELHKLYEQAGKSSKAYPDLKETTKKMLQKNGIKATPS